MLLLERVIVPVGVSVPGEMSETVTVHVVGTPTVTDEPHVTAVRVDVELTVIGSQLLDALLLPRSPE